MEGSSGGERGISRHVAARHRQMHGRGSSVRQCEREAAAGGICGHMRNLHVARADAGGQHFCHTAARDGRREFVVGIEHHTAALLHRFREHSLLHGDGRAADHELNVCGADVGDDAHVRRGDSGERRDLSRMVHPHFAHRDFVVRLCRQHGERQADVIVQIAYRRVHFPTLAEHGARKVFGGSLAIAAREADHNAAPVAPVIARETLEAVECVVGADDRHILRPAVAAVHHQRARAGGDGLRQKVVRIKAVTFERNEERARRNIARVRGHRRNDRARVALFEDAAAPVCCCGQGDRFHGR